MKLVTIHCRQVSKIRLILIHTSVKLVTYGGGSHLQWNDILIHTSVKLVTSARNAEQCVYLILIHTSVKLVTAL